MVSDVTRGSNEPLAQCCARRFGSAATSTFYETPWIFCLEKAMDDCCRSCAGFMTGATWSRLRKTGPGVGTMGEQVSETLRVGGEKHWRALQLLIGAGAVPQAFEVHQAFFLDHNEAPMKLRYFVVKEQYFTYDFQVMA